MDFKGAQGFDQHGAADAVIHGFGHQAPAQVEEGSLESRHIADLHRAVFEAGCAHVDKILGGRRHFGCREIRLFHADHSRRAVGEVDASAHQGMRADSADAGKADETIRVDMRGDQTDLVHVGRQHDPPAVFALFPFTDDQVAERVHADFIGQGFHFGTDDLPDGRLVAGRAERFSEFLDQVFHIFTMML